MAINNEFKLTSRKCGELEPEADAPREVIRSSWQPHVMYENDDINFRAYTFCVLYELSTALHRRDVFVTPSWRYADPRSGLLNGPEWESIRPIMYRTLGLSSDPQPVLTALTVELDKTYRTVAEHLPDNSAVRFEIVDDRSELILSPLG